MGKRRGKRSGSSLTLRARRECRLTRSGFGGRGFFVLADGAGEVLQGGGCGVGDDIPGKWAVSELERAVALGRGGESIIALRGCGRADEGVEDVLAVVVDQGGDGAALEVVEAAAGEGKAGRGEVTDVGSEIEAAGEPRLDGVAVGGDDVEEMVGHQGADVGVDELAGEVVRRGRAARDGPGERGDEDQRGGDGEGAGGETPVRALR